MKTITEGKSWNHVSKEAKDLVLYSDQDPDLKAHKESIKKNLSKKKADGRYDEDDALGLWSHHADRSAISCCAKHGEGKKAWKEMFPSQTRREAAKYLEDFHKDSLHESLNENQVIVEEFNPEKASFYLMLDDVLNKNLIGFKQKFNEAFISRLYEGTENLKSNLSEHVWNGRLEEISASLLGNYIKKAARDGAKSRVVGWDSDFHGDTDGGDKGYSDYAKRLGGIDLAANKLTRKAMKPAPNFNEEIYESNFSRLQAKLERKGLSSKEAGGIAYKEGKAKYGKKGMAEKARRGREDD